MQPPGDKSESLYIPWQQSAFLVGRDLGNSMCRDRSAQQLFAIYLAIVNKPRPKVLTEFLSSLPVISVIILPD